jgi:hypothetical protein
MTGLTACARLRRSADRLLSKAAVVRPTSRLRFVEARRSFSEGGSFKQRRKSCATRGPDDARAGKTIVERTLLGSQQPQEKAGTKRQR